LAVWSPTPAAGSLAPWSSTGIASSLSQDIDDFYASSEEADAALAEILQ